MLPIITKVNRCLKRSTDGDRVSVARENNIESLREARLSADVERERVIIFRENKSKSLCEAGLAADRESDCCP